MIHGCLDKMQDELVGSPVNESGEIKWDRYATFITSLLSYFSSFRYCELMRSADHFANVFTFGILRPQEKVLVVIDDDMIQ